jgi:galactose mutarotase-like enzyme
MVKADENHIKLSNALVWLPWDPSEETGKCTRVKLPTSQLLVCQQKNNSSAKIKKCQPLLRSDQCFCGKMPGADKKKLTIYAQLWLRNQQKMKQTLITYTWKCKLQQLYKSTFDTGWNGFCQQPISNISNAGTRILFQQSSSKYLHGSKRSQNRTCWQTENNGV